MSYKITDEQLKTDRKPLSTNKEGNFTFHEINSSYFKHVDGNRFYIHSFILTYDEHTKQEVKVDVSFNIEILEANYKIETFLMDNLPDILSLINKQKNEIPDHLFDLQKFSNICYSYSSEIDPIEHILPY